LKTLKIILQYKYIYLILAILSILFSIIFNTIDFKSKYNINDTNINGYINFYYIDGNKLTIELNGKEKIICNYYFKDLEDKNNFINKYNLGDYISLFGVVNEVNNNTVFNLFNYKEYLKYQRTYYTFEIEEISILKSNKRMDYKIKNSIMKSIDKKDNKEYYYAFILGTSYYISDNVSDSYINNGISHLLAVSGTNISLLSLFLMKVLKKYKFKDIITILFIIFYMFITNYSPSILRAGIFFIILILNKKYKLNINIINLMLLSLFILIIIDPYIIYKVGFQYSYIISFYLIYFNKLISKYKNNIYKLFIVSFIAFLSSFPITINNFFNINLLSIFINIMFVPIFTIVIFPFTLITYALPFLNPILKFIISIFEYLSLTISKINILTFSLQKVNIIFIIIYYLISTYILIGLLNNKYKRLLILVILLIFHYNINYFNNSLQITYIDVGQGDSSLIMLPNNKGNILIDTGGKEIYYEEVWNKRNKTYSIGKDTICPYLKSIGVKKLDYLILTHGDNDHLGEAIPLINCIKVDNVIFNYGSLNSNEINIINKLNIPYHLYKEGNSIKINNYKFDIVSPIKDYNDENDNSLVIHFKYNNYEFLFTGDISKEVEKDINKEMNIEFLKVAHHGSKTSSSIEFLNMYKPKYSIISVGKDNKFGHPSQETINNLNDINSKIYKTSEVGSIKIILKDNGYEIKTSI